VIVVSNEDAERVLELLEQGKGVLEIARLLGQGINVTYMPDGTPIETFVKPAVSIP